MLSAHETKTLLQAFYGGVPPPPRLAAKSLVGLDTLLGEWRKDLAGYVANGGSLLRIVVAPAGSGKTHLGEALKAEAANRGFLVCQIDAQSQGTNADDLLLYRAFCGGLRLPAQYLDGLVEEAGLFGVLRDVATRMTGPEVRAKLKDVKVPVPALKDALANAIDAIQLGRLPGPSGPGWQAMIQSIGGEKFARYGSLAKLRLAYEDAFRGMKRLPGKRDARLWMESMLLALRPLGLPRGAAHPRRTRRAEDHISGPEHRAAPAAARSPGRGQPAGHVRPLSGARGLSRPCPDEPCGTQSAHRALCSRRPGSRRAS